MLAVYTGAAVNALSQVAANDDEAQGVVTSRVSFNATSGTTYRIAIDGFNGATGAITLKVTGPVTPCGAVCVFRNGFE
jgi:hypothetical protein